MATTTGLTDAPEIKMCSACGNAPRAAQDSTNPHCKGCRAVYARAYRQVSTEMTHAKAFREGVRAMKDLLANEFEQIRGTGAFGGQEIAAMIRQAPGPLLD